MSLLLDALKKAADDKQKTSRAELTEIQATKFESVSKQSNEKSGEYVTQTVSVDTVPVFAERVIRPAEKIFPHTREVTPESEPGSSEELTLYIDDDENKQSVVNDGAIVEERLPKSNVEPLAISKVVKKVNDYNADVIDKTVVDKPIISDDALSLLIDKTNRDVKKNKNVLIISVATISLTILLSGGFYFYSDMLEEVADIEHRHLIAMTSMRLKADREKTPDKSAIIQNLVSDARLEEKVEYAKAQRVNEKKKVEIRQQAVKHAVMKKPENTEFLVKKTNKSDVVGDSLEAAWLAYQNANYSEAKHLYKEALRLEERNRDAQLGLAAIAVIEKDDALARNIYLSLLKDDPRDPIAAAAITGLSSGESSLNSGNDYLLSLLQKNPDAPHLNFSLANNYAQQRKWKLAQRYYFKAWQLNSDNADYIYNLAVSMDQLDKPQQAISFYQDCLSKSDNKQVNFSRVAVNVRIKELLEL